MFDGIDGFDSSKEEYSHTLFRFPLRNKESSISNKTYTPDDLLDLLQILESEAKYLLLFLRSIEKIKVLVIQRSGKKSQIFEVKIEGEKDTLRKKRDLLSRQLIEEYKLNKRYGISSPLSFTSTFTIDTISNRKGREAKNSTKWLICNQVGSTQRDVTRAAEQVCVFPTVGTALELETSIQSEGRIFCFLPLPSEASTALPVHVHGTFSLDDNRRQLKWPSREGYGDPTAEWNIFLCEKMLPECYKMLLTEALKILRNDATHFYQAIPTCGKSSIRGTGWERLLKPLYNSIFDELKCFCTISNQWVTLNEATFVLESSRMEIPDIVYEIMQECYNLVKLPEKIEKAIHYVHLENKMMKLSPELVRNYLKSNPSSYHYLGDTEKLDLLKYCLSDNNYNELIGLQLVPLVNGSFECFQHYYHKNLYVCTEECFIALLPVGHELVISLHENQVLQQKLQNVAKSEDTQLRLLECEHVAKILKESYPESLFEKYDEVSVGQLRCSKEWFEEFWEWVENKNLNLFRNLFLVPITSSSSFSVRKLIKGNTVLVERHQTCELETVLKEFDVTCILQKDVPYVRHRNMSILYQNFHPFNCNGVLQAIRDAAHNKPWRNQFASVTSAEAEIFQRFIRNAPQTFEREISYFPIFQCVSDSSPVYVNEGEVILEPPHIINSDYFPSNFTLLSSSKNIKSIVRMCKNVEIPETLAEFLEDSVFPLITNKTFTPWENVPLLMEEIFKVFNVIEHQMNTFANIVSNVPFLKARDSNVFKRPCDLFDPLSGDNQSLYQGEDVFPLSPFNKRQHLIHLDKCGLKMSVTAQDIYDILLNISKAPGLRKVDKIQFQRALYVFKFLDNNKDKLYEYVDKAHHFLKLSDAICSLGKEKSIFPVQSKPSVDYPEALPWKGSDNCHHLTSMSDSVMPFNSSNSSIQCIIGSSMLLIECPSPLCSLLKSECPIDKIISHFTLLTDLKDEISAVKITKISLQVYEYLHANFQRLIQSGVNLADKKWVWFEETEEFLAPNQVTFLVHETFHQKLVPYIYELPRWFKKFSRLFTHFGAYNRINDKILVSVLERVKADTHTSDKIRWTFVCNILNWVTEDGTERATDKVCSDINLLVPIETSDSGLHLEKAENVLYTDIKYIEKFSQRTDKSRKFIHHKVKHLSKYLGLKAVSRELNISQDVFNDVGPYESLQRRLQNILGDYSEGLTIIKELLQNADDAEASEVNICYDTRTHTADPDELLFPGMVKTHGPALIVHNNSTFSNSDFKNIQKLAGATKRDQPLKIGKFGLGFCSVYHITDIPSFVSRESLFIFDPALLYLEKEIEDKRKPGKKVKFTEGIIQYSEQMSPYKDLFHFDSTKSFNGTIFRLPFRNSISDQCIGKKCYDAEDINTLYEQIQKSGPELLLFLTHLAKITLSIISSSSNRRILEIKKELVEQLPSGARILKISVINTKTSHTNISHWLLADHQSSNQVSSVACSLKEGHPRIPCQISGEVFCFLPLHLKTGLPVHISANFAVMNDRKGIHYSDSNKTDEVKFNEDLMHSSIPQSYFKLLIALKDLWNDNIVSNYKFFSFWPLAKNLETKNPWQIFIPCLYDLISQEAICYSDFAEQWQTPKQSKYLSPNFLHTSCHSNILEVIKKLKKPVVNLPIDYHEHITLALFSENDFLTLFFKNMSVVSFTSRNKILIGLIMGYTYDSSKDRRNWIVKHSCIPCMPDGKILKKSVDVIDPKSHIASLYKVQEHVFPIKELLAHPFHATLIELGIISVELPMHMIAERAKTVEKLYCEDKLKALQRTQILLDCMKTHVIHELPKELEDLKDIRFLPILQKPHDYPKIVTWAGDGKTLLSSSDQLLIETDYSHKMNHLIGSQRLIVSQHEPSRNGGCGRIPDKVVSALGLKNKPQVEDILKHLILVSKSYSSCNKQDNAKYVKAACDKIYSYLNDFIRRNKKEDQKFIEYFHDTKYKLLWNEDEFVNPTNVSTSWKLNGPYLYHVPYSIRNLPHLLEQLRIKKRFDKDWLVEVLLQIKNDYKDKPITTACSKIVLNIAEVLAKEIPEDETREHLLAQCLLYDEEMHMQYVRDLSYNDAPWCKLEKDFTFVHHKFPRPILEKLGVKFVRSRVMDHYDTSDNYFVGVPFGQHEELTQRIKNILDTYTHDETLLKELLQNADDAKATKLYFILDERTHGTKILPSSEWKDLQGPSLLVWNDKGFTDEDLMGIQKLGLGSKRSKAESIGQYGIGFNVVYHITDCPSLLTNGDTLCIFDPHCRYIPGANAVKPGRRLNNVSKEFWKNMSDLESCYLQNNINNCPSEIQHSGSLFRFPLRSSRELVLKSKIVDENSVPILAQELKAQFMEWMPKLKEGLLFLKHVVEIAFCSISNSEFNIVSKYTAVLDENGIHERSNLYMKAKQFREDCPSPFIANYTLQLIEEAPNNSTETWLIQQGVGDVNNPSQHWEYLSHIYPMHGLAAKIQGQDFTPKIFCFLPLPMASNLPVHVNANFILDSSSRSSLWRSRDVERADDKKKWNDRLIEALGSSYAQFVVTCQGHFITNTYTKSSKKHLQDDITRYYKMFPKWIEIDSPPEGEMLNLAKHVYEKINTLNCKVLIIVSTDHGQNNPPSSAKKCPLTVSWDLVASKDPAKQAYFLDTSKVEKEIPKILKAIGMKLTAASADIKEHFEEVSINIPEATEDEVFKYYSHFYNQISPTGKFPCPIHDSKFKEVKMFKTFIQFIAHCKSNVQIKSRESEEHTETVKTIISFPQSPHDVPVILTADGCIRQYNEGGPVIRSKFSPLFPKKSDCFLHPDLLDLELDETYFLNPCEANKELIFKILDETLPRALKSSKIVTSASSCVDVKKLLKPLWQCLYDDQVFFVHLTDILSHWALILSNENDLYRSSHSHEYLMPLCRPKSLSSDGNSELEPLHEVFSFLKKHRMPTVAMNVVLKSYKLCPSFKYPESVLKNLYYLHQEQPLCISLSDYFIPILFSYFKKIHFQNDPASLKYIKALPLFTSVDGRNCSISGEVYLMPSNIRTSGINRILPCLDQVFLDCNGSWNNLATADTLRIYPMEPLQFYILGILPYFGKLSENERLEQLQHIRDHLFDDAENNAKKMNVLAVEFIATLKKAPMFPIKNVLSPIAMFADSTHPLLKLFPDDYAFLPESYSNDKWLLFFKKLDLQAIPKEDEFLLFCKQVSKGKTSSKANLLTVSKALLNCLFQTEEWYSETDFLREASMIPFVEPMSSKLHEAWISSPFEANVHYIHDRGREIHTALVCLKDCAHIGCSILVWTVCPVVKVPELKLSIFFLSEMMRKLREKEFCSHLGICLEPSESQVLQNITNISKSRFSNFKLFEKYSEDCIRKDDNKTYSLVAIVKKNLAYMFKINSDCSMLLDLACIPVSSEYNGNDSKPVLVKPLQAIGATDDMQPEVHPFLCVIPQELRFSMQLFNSNMKVNYQVKAENIQYALSLIQQHVETPLDHNSIEAVKALLKLLNHQLSTSKDCIEEGSLLYLPNHSLELMESTRLIYDDQGYHKDIQYTDRILESTSKYSVLSLLCKNSEEVRRYYGYTSMKEFVSKLPTFLTPMSFSVDIKSQLQSDCKKQKDSNMTTMIKKAFNWENFAEILRITTKNYSENTEWNIFLECLKKCLDSINVITISKLKVDIAINKSDAPYIIGYASMDFLLVFNNNEPTLYIDSSANADGYNVLESFSKYFLTEVMKHAGVTSIPVTDLVGSFTTLLKAKDLDDLNDFLKTYEIYEFQADRKFDYNLNPVLGEPIPQDWHHRLHADLLNNFRPQELIGYEEDENKFIFARIEHKANQVSKMEDEDDQMDMYVIRIKEIPSDGYIEEECIRTVPMIELFKIFRIKDTEEENECKELKLYDPENESVQYWEATKDQSLKEIYIKICEELNRIKKISNEDLKRKCLKAMFLKWHPDKNNHPLATKAFQFLQRQIDRMKRGLDLEDVEMMEEFSPQSQHTYYNNSWFSQWEDLSKQRAKSYQREQRTFRSQAGTNREWFGTSSGASGISVSPDMPKANVWLQQAIYDVRAMEVMFQESMNKPELSGHVCFLAHQVAEKSLKAGMYAKYGLHPDSLKSHDLIYHANALADVNSDATELPVKARILQSSDYYLSTRYPNRFGSIHKVPAEQISTGEAVIAVDAANTIYTIVNNFW